MEEEVHCGILHVGCKNPLNPSFFEASATKFVPKLGQCLCRDCLTVRRGGVSIITLVSSLPVLITTSQTLLLGTSGLEGCFIPLFLVIMFQLRFFIYCVFVYVYVFDHRQIYKCLHLKEV